MYGRSFSLLSEGSPMAVDEEHEEKITWSLSPYTVWFQIEDPSGIGMDWLDSKGISVELDGDPGRVFTLDPSKVADSVREVPADILIIFEGDLGIESKWDIGRPWQSFGSYFRSGPREVALDPRLLRQLRTGRKPRSTTSREKIPRSEKRELPK
jgi:hypothetical protein